jgi:CHAT domain-containing protein/Tfp pilus assembly protein PilF
MGMGKLAAAALLGLLSGGAAAPPATPTPSAAAAPWPAESSGALPPGSAAPSSGLAPPGPAEKPTGPPPGPAPAPSGSAPGTAPAAKGGPALAAEALALAPGAPATREMAAGESHAYAAALQAGHAYRVAVEQLGIDVEVAANAADGRPRIAVDSPLDRQGTEVLLIVPQAAAGADRAASVAYRIEVRAREPGSPPPARYAIRIDEVAEGGRRDAAAALTAAGRLYLEGTAEARRRALPLYRQARDLLRAAGDRRGEAQALYEAAVMARLVDQARDAGEMAREVLPLWQALGDSAFAAAAENESGLDSWLLGDREAARAAFGRALGLAEAASDRYGAAVAQSNLCLMELSRGELRQGAACYDRAEPLLAAVRAEELLASALTSAGRAYDALGEPRQARARYEEALARLRSTGNRAGEARTLNNLGVLTADFGDVEEALPQYGEALAIFQALDDRRWQARVLNNLGSVYHATGAYGQALAAFEQALALWRAVADRAGEAATLINLGLVHGLAGEPREALACHRQALDIERALGDRRGEAIALTQLGRTEVLLGDAAAALPQLVQAGDLLAAAGDRRNQAEALRGQAAAREALGDAAGALAAYDQALAAARAAGHLPVEALALFGKARAEHRFGQAGAARADAAAALTAIESLRTRIGDPDLKASFSALIHRAYEIDLEILMEAHRADPVAGLDREALAVAERARARTLLDLLGTAGIHLREGADPALLARREELAARLAAKAERAATARRPPAAAAAGTPLAPPQTSQAPQTLQSTQAAQGPQTSRTAETPRTPEAIADAEQQEILRELDLVEAELRERSPAYAALAHPQPLDAAGVQALLDPDTLLLVYSLGEARSYLWAVTRDRVDAFELPARAAVEQLARRLHEQWSAGDPAPRRAATDLQLGSAGTDAQPGRAATAPQAGRAATDLQTRRAAAGTAAALSAMLLGPVADRLGHLRLAVVPDGALSYLPFGALPLPGTPGEVLLDRHELVVLPSASALAAERAVVAARPRPEKWLAVLADPVFGRNDPRLGAAGGPALASVSATATATATIPAMRSPPPVPGELPGELPRLPASRQEAEAIAAMAPAGEAMVALDFAASREAVLGDRLSGYRVVHFATHAVLDTEHPALSGLALSMVGPDGRPRQGFLHLRDIYNLRLRADLVVLSGCRTALGREVRGEGLVGLARGFQYAGAARVVASLWRVEDRATAALMARFYHALWTLGMPPAAALRAAQLSLRAERPYRDPTYWAGFVLVGDWR